MEHRELYRIASSINEKFSSMTSEELEEYRKKQKEEKQKREEEYNKQLEKDVQTMNCNDFLNKHYDLNYILVLSYCLDPSKKALFNKSKRISNYDGKIFLVKYEINGKWYWGLPEESDNNE